MEYENFGALSASIEQTIEADTDFQDTIATLSNEEKDAAIQSKKSELFDQEIKNLSLTAKEAAKAKELADNYKKRAEKAEDALKNGGPKKAPEQKTESDISFRDALVLTNAKVTDEEDIDEVIEYSKFKNISIAEALKHPIIKASLAEKAEKRKTASATNTATARRSVNKPDATTLLRNLSNGEVPDAGTSDAEEVFWARRGGKR